MKPLTAQFKTWLETSSQKQKWGAALFAFSLLSTLGLLIIKGAAGSSNDPLESTPLYFAGVFVKLIVVLLMIVASSVIFRRWLQPGMGSWAPRQMRLIETVRLSPKQALHLVSVGNQQLLIGATDQSIALITPVELDPGPVAAENPSAQLPVPFASLLSSFSSHLPGTSTK